jgi:hypothetical protein
MKKWIKMGILAVFVIGVVCLSGCTTSLVDEHITGKYVYEKDPAQYIELHGDGTFYRLGAYGIGASGTYKIVNNTIRTCGQENCVEYTIDGNALVRMNMRYLNELVIIVTSPVTTATTPSTTQTTIPNSNPAYSPGDIIARTASSSDQMLFVITNYDKSTDRYTRQLIYKNSDGSWGHFVTSQSEKVPRTLVESVYPVKIAHVQLSAIPIITPTVR